MLYNNPMKQWEHLVNWRKHTNEDEGNSYMMKENVQKSIQGEISWSCGSYVSHQVRLK